MHVGKVYRGIKVLLNPDVYATDRRITWQAFSSSTKKQTAMLDFVNNLPGRKLQGSLFVIDSMTAKDIRHFSAIPDEEEVLFPSNSQFKVERVVTSRAGEEGLAEPAGRLQHDRPRRLRAQADCVDAHGHCVTMERRRKARAGAS